jgi:hypothetical protein
MKTNYCVPENISKALVAGFLLVGALAFFIAGFTILPLVGFAMAVPLVILSIYFFSIHVNDQCELEP